MKKEIKSRWRIEVIACLLIILFVYAGISKLRAMEQFRIQLRQSPLVTPFAYPLASAVPSIEILLAVCLAFPKLRLIGMYGSYTLMVLFTFYVIAILQLDKNIPCSCGGILESMGWTEHLIFNVTFSLIAFAGVLMTPGYPFVSDDVMH